MSTIFSLPLSKLFTSDSPADISKSEDDERVYEWAERFQVARRRWPMSHDLMALNKFTFVKIQRHINEENDYELRKYSHQVLKEHFNRRDWFDAGDCRIWFTDEQLAMNFKLYWSR